MRNARFAGIAEKLLSAGVTPRHVRRTLFELSGHFDDLVEEIRARGVDEREAEAEAAERLGADQVVAAVLARPELRSWMRRWPLVAFVFLPLATYGALFVAGIATLVALLEFTEHQLHLPLATSGGMQQFTNAYLTGVAWLLPAGAAAVCCAFARLHRAPILWPIIGMALISLLGATTNAQLTLPPLVDRPALGAGLGFNSDALGLPLLRASLTFLIALLPYLWFRRDELHTA